jgi:hypothetical protein
LAELEIIPWTGQAKRKSKNCSWPILDMGYYPNFFIPWLFKFAKLKNNFVHHNPSLPLHTLERAVFIERNALFHVLNLK